MAMVIMETAWGRHVDNHMGTHHMDTTLRNHMQRTHHMSFRNLLRHVLIQSMDMDMDTTMGTIECFDAHYFSSKELKYRSMQ